MSKRTFQQKIKLKTNKQLHLDTKEKFVKTFVYVCEARTLEPDERERSKGVDVKEN